VSRNCRVTYCTVRVGWDNEERLNVVVTQVHIALAAMTWLHSIVAIKVPQSLLRDVNSPCNKQCVISASVLANYMEHSPA
jgi:hypothetical protein